MTTCCEVDGTFTDLELPSPTFSFPFCVVTILHDHPPLVVLPADGLVDGVALTVPRDGVGELVVGVLLLLVNLPLLSLCLFMHST
jgi:hypothetical protein